MARVRWIRRVQEEPTPVRVRTGVDTSQKLTDILAGNYNGDGMGALQAGDAILLGAGVTYTTSAERGFVLPVVAGVSATTPCWLMSNGTLPASGVRVIPATHGAQLARLRTSYANGPCLMAAATAAHWRLLGLDCAGTTATGSAGPRTIDLGNTDGATGAYCTAAERLVMQGFIVDRCYIHPPDTTWESPDNDTVYCKYEKGIVADCGVTIKNSCLSGFAPRDYYFLGPANAYGILSEVGPGPLVITNNYIEAGFAGLFLGGADAPAEHTATISAASLGETTGTVTLSSVAGLQVGQYLAMQTGFSPLQFFKWCAGEVTDIAGTVVTFTVKEHEAGAAAAPAVGSTVYFRTSASATSITTVSASPAPTTTSMTVADATDINIGTLVLTAISGADQRCVYEVTNKAGNDLTLSFVTRGTALMHEPPLVGGTAQWGTYIWPRNVTFSGNRVQNRLAWAAQAGQYMKGFFEIKCVENFTCEGNYFYCYPYDVNGDGSLYYGTPLAFPTYNQNGGSPWTANKNIIFRYNWVVGGRGADVGATLIFQGSDPYNVTDGNSRNYVVAHNVFEPHPSQVVGLGILAHTGASVGIDNLTFQHNTCINTGSFASNWSAGPGTSVTIKDNVLGVGSYGLNCQLSPYTVATCYPSGDLTFNLLVDTESVYPSANYWPSDANTHEVATWAGVGFEDSDAQDYRLTVSSPGYQAASDATDMGADFSLIYAAMNDWPVGWTP